MNKKFRFNDNWRILEREDILFIFNVATKEQFEIVNDLEESKFLLDYLNKEKEFSLQKVINHLLKEFSTISKSWIKDSWETLKRKQIIREIKKEPSFPDGYLLGLDRQLDYLDGFFPEEGGLRKQKELYDQKVAILGIGVVAQFTILSLLASGIGNFLCVDFDTVEDRNIGRQPLLTNDDIGRPKTEVTKEVIQERRDGVSVDSKNMMIKSSDDVKKLVKDCDIVLHSCDYPRVEVHRWINNACLELKKANLLMYSGVVGPLTVPYKNACYGCTELFTRKKVKFYDDLVDLVQSEGMERYPELASVGALTGTIAAKEVVSYLL